MLEVDLTQRAKDDLAEIWNYVAANNVSAADRLIRRFARVARMPGLGEVYDDSLPGTRFLTTGAYVIIYVAREDRIQISRVLHSARDWQNMLDAIDDFESE